MDMDDREQCIFAGRSGGADRLSDVLVSFGMSSFIGIDETGCVNLRFRLGLVDFVSSGRCWAYGDTEKERCVLGEADG